MLIEIKNPILALEMGLQHVGKASKLNSYVIRMAKAAGYKVKIKYKFLEFEL